MTQSIFKGVNLGLFLWCWLSGVTRVSSEVGLPPRVTWRRENQEIFAVRSGRSSNITVNCMAEGSPSPSFEWRRDDQVLGESDFLIKAYNNGTLYFRDFSTREDGLYQCLARNIYGTSMSHKVPILFDGNPRKIPTDDVTKTIEMGSPVSLKCADTPPTVTEYIRRWYFKKDTVQLELTDRISTDIEGTLWFSYTEEGDSNAYVCGLAPRVAQSQETIQIYNTVVLAVTPGQKVTSEPRLGFKSGRGNVKVLLNRTATLECMFTGFPIPTISWKNSSNQELPGNNPRFRLDDFNRKLFITNVRPEDEGIFSCTANNGHGEKTEFINVNVTSPPFKVPNQGLTSLIQPEYSDVTLRCQARAANGESLDRPAWYRNTLPLREDVLPDPARYSFNQDGTLLFIRNISKSVDTACFQCNVTNSEGYTFYDGFLRVIDSIMILKRPNAEIEVTENDVVDITITAIGDACCDIHQMWILNDQPLTNEELQLPPFEKVQNSVTLLFNASSVSDSVLTSRLGKYRVRVSNTYQNVSVEFTISKKGVVAADVAAAGFQLWWLAIILGILAIIIAILVVICCIKRNYPGETYQLEKTELKHHLNPKEELLDQSFQEI